LAVIGSAISFASITSIEQWQPLVSASGQTANDLHLTFTRHLLIQSHRVTYLTSDEVTNRVTQGRIPRILGLSNEAYALDHTEWITVSADTIAQIRIDGSQRQRRQEPFSLLPPLEQAYPSTVILSMSSSKG
jgi:hypothetical protein